MFFAIGKNWLIANVKLIGLENFLTKHLSKLKNKGYIIYPLILATFPLLSVYFANIGELNFSEIVGLLIAILLSTLLLLVLAKAIFKEDNKVTIFGILVLILFFFFWTFKRPLCKLQCPYINQILHIRWHLYCPGVSI